MDFKGSNRKIDHGLSVEDSACPVFAVLAVFASLPSVQITHPWSGGWI